MEKLVTTSSTVLSYWLGRYHWAWLSFCIPFLSGGGLLAALSGPSAADFEGTGGVWTSFLVTGIFWGLLGLMSGMIVYYVARIPIGNRLLRDLATYSWVWLPFVITFIFCQGFWAGSGILEYYERGWRDPWYQSSYPNDIVMMFTPADLWRAAINASVPFTIANLVVGLLASVVSGLLKLRKVILLKSL